MHPSGAMPGPDLRLRLRDVHLALRDAATANLTALLDGQPPVALSAPPLVGLFRDPARPDPLAGFGADLWRSATLPEAEFTSHLMADPGLALALGSPRSEIGATLLAPLILRDALSEGGLRHDLAQHCRRFLCERVLFHPGPPPLPLFSTGGLALLVASQDAHGAALGADFAPLRAAAQALRGPDQPLGHWDQWLLRRMADTPGWTLPERAEDLPWVTWRGAEDAPLPVPDATDPTLPAYWPRILDLLP